MEHFNTGPPAGAMRRRLPPGVEPNEGITDATRRCCFDCDADVEAQPWASVTYGITVRRVAPPSWYIRLL